LSKCLHKELLLLS